MTVLKGIVVAERRRQPRMDVQVSLGLQVSGRVVMARSRNFSATGVFIETGLNLELQTPVQIFLMPPGAPQAIRLVGVVARVMPEGVGVAFAPLAPEIREGFDRFMAALMPSAAPAEVARQESLADAFDPKVIEEAMRREGQERSKKRDLARRLHEAGRRALEAGQLEMAVSMFERAIDLAPGIAAVHHDLGTAYYQQGDVNRAVKQFDRALQLEPERD